MTGPLGMYQCQQGGRQTTVVVETEPHLRGEVDQKEPEEQEPWGD